MVESNRYDFLEPMKSYYLRQFHAIFGWKNVLKLFFTKRSVCIAHDYSIFIENSLLHYCDPLIYTYVYVGINFSLTTRFFYQGFPIILTSILSLAINTVQVPLKPALDYKPWILGTHFLVSYINCL